MRCIRPVRLISTMIPHRNAANREDGYYLMAVTVDGDLGMMSSVLDVTNENGHGVELTVATQGDGAVFDVRVLVEQTSRPSNLHPSLYNYTIWETLSQPTSLTCRLGTCAILRQESPGVFCLQPEQRFSIDLSGLGNVVCVHCGRRTQLGRAIKTDQPCLCGAEFPELRIPLFLPAAPAFSRAIS